MTVKPFQPGVAPTAEKAPVQASGSRTGSAETAPVRAPDARGAVQVELSPAARAYAQRVAAAQMEPEVRPARVAEVKAELAKGREVGSEVLASKIVDDEGLLSAMWRGGSK